MAEMSFEGADSLKLSFEKLSQIPYATKRKMIQAASEVVVKEQKKQATIMLKGPYNRGHVQASVQAKEPKIEPDGISQDITFNGTVRDEYHKKGARVAEIAFINEYGKKGQPARPFVKTANEEAGDSAVRAQEQELERFISSCEL